MIIGVIIINNNLQPQTITQLSFFQLLFKHSSEKHPTPLCPTSTHQDQKSPRRMAWWYCPPGCPVLQLSGRPGRAITVFLVRFHSAAFHSGFSMRGRKKREKRDAVEKLLDGWIGGLVDGWMDGWIGG